MVIGLRIRAANLQEISKDWSSSLAVGAGGIRWACMDLSELVLSGQDEWGSEDAGADTGSDGHLRRWKAD